MRSLHQPGELLQYDPLYIFYAISHPNSCPVHICNGPTDVLMSMQLPFQQSF